MGQGMGCCGGRPIGAESNMEAKPASATNSAGHSPANGKAAATTTGAATDVKTADDPHHASNGTASGPVDPVAAALALSNERAAAKSLDAKTNGGDAKDGSGGVSRSPSEVSRINAALWDQFFKQTMNAYSKIGEKHMSLIGPTPPTEEQKRSLAELTEEVQHEVQTNMAHLLGKVFDHYDRNKSGDLDEFELKAVIDDYVDAAQLALSKCLTDVFAPDGAMMKAALDVRARLAMSDAQLMAEIDGLKATLTQDMNVLNQNLNQTKKGSSSLVKQLVAQFDTNKDGKVTRSEFVTNFHKLAQSLQMSGPLAA